MPDYIFLMHASDTPPGQHPDWGPYLASLRERGKFQGGSAIGEGLCLRKSGPAPERTASLTGFLRIQAGDIEEARSLLAGNPVYEAGGTVEVRELPRTGAGPAEESAARTFERARLNGVVFRDCAMAGAKFDDVSLAQAVFNNVNLRGASLSDVNLSGVAIENANIEGMTVFGYDVHALIRGQCDRKT